MSTPQNTDPKLAEFLAAFDSKRKTNRGRKKKCCEKYQRKGRFCKKCPIG